MEFSIEKFKPHVEEVSLQHYAHLQKIQKIKSHVELERRKDHLKTEEILGKFRNFFNSN